MLQTAGKWLSTLANATTTLLEILKSLLVKTQNWVLTTSMKPATQPVPENTTRCT
nr:MAG TPA: hypothetical protein [Caudoviricetes sp.]